MVLVCQVILQDPSIKILCNFVGGNCGSGDIIVLVFQMVSKDHMTKGSCNFMGDSP